MIKNYRPVSFLIVCGKVFEKIRFNSLFKYLNDNSLLNGNHRGDSCVHYLLKKTHAIYKPFDVNQSLEVRRVFLDLSRAFDEVWHDGLMYKLRRLGIWGKHYGLIHSLIDINDRLHGVVLNS